MSYPYRVPEGYAAEEEITAVIAEDVASHLEFAQRRPSAYQLHCAESDQHHGMNTEEFLERFEAGLWEINGIGRGGTGERPDRPVTGYGSDRASDLVDLGLPRDECHPLHRSIGAWRELGWPHSGLKTPTTS